MNNKPSQLLSNTCLHLWEAFNVSKQYKIDLNSRYIVFSVQMSKFSTFSRNNIFILLGFSILSFEYYQEGYYKNISCWRGVCFVVFSHYYLQNLCFHLFFEEVEHLVASTPMERMRTYLLRISYIEQVIERFDTEVYFSYLSEFLPYCVPNMCYSSGFCISILSRWVHLLRQFQWFVASEWCLTV